jgi:lipopolysaccharide export LptBFGC system permease protein LptF
MHPTESDDMNTTMERQQTRRASESPPKVLAPRALAGIALLTTTAAIHIAELSGKIEETAYLGAGYIALIAASMIAVVMIATHDRRGWALGALACAATIIGFVLTRTTGLPAAHGDVGNWSETIAVWSLVAEGGFLAVAAWDFARRA